MSLALCEVWGCRPHCLDSEGTLTPTKMQVEAGHWKQSKSWQQDTTGEAALGIQTGGRGRLPEGSDRPVSGGVWELCQEGGRHRVEAHR